MAVRCTCTGALHCTVPVLVAVAGHGGDHGGARVAAEAVLEDARELGVAEGHKHEALPLALPERVDAVRQRQQRPVDGAAVPQLQPKRN
eukprot:1898129-Pyramimonas_sp.AAC.1